MSPSKGRRRTPGRGGEAGAGRASSPVSARRLGLLVFGAAFAILFLVIGIAVGIGEPAIPSGDVAIVEGAPGEAGRISESAYEHALELAAVQAGLKSAPKPGEEKYAEIQKAALSSLFDVVWIEGLAAEMGISATPKEVAAELKKLKKENFKTEAEYRQFIKKAHYTPEDVNDRVKLQILSTRIQSRVTEGAPKPGEDEVEGYYEEAKATQFTQKASRSIRLILNKDRKKAEAAQALLEKDHSATSWGKVAKKYSEDPLTKESGGLRSGLTEGALEEPLDADVFGAPKGRLEGPIKTKQGYYVFEVESSTPEKVQALKDVKPQIESQLTQRSQQEYFTAFVTNYNSTWSSRTFCASGYVIERCANFKGSAHPATASPACYEAHPKGGLPETGCPAPVSQLIPALPGTVSLLEPRGRPMAQRPQPAGLKPVEGAGTTTLPISPSGAP